MSKTLRRLAATSAAAVALTGLAVPLAPAPALAYPAMEIEYFLSDADGDGTYGLWVRTTPAGAATKVVENGSVNLSDLSVSQDGSRIAYLQTTLNASGNPVRDQVVVRDISNRLVRVVSDVLETNTTGNSSPALSSDGNTVVWTSGGPNSTPSILKAATGAGSAAVTRSGFFDPVFLDSTTLLAQDAASGAFKTFPVSGNTTPQAVALDGNTAFDVAVSADHTQLAWAVDTTGGGATPTADIQVASLTLTNGAATLGSPVTVATGMANLTPAFSRNGNTVYFTKFDASTATPGPGDIYSTPAAGPSSSAAVTTATTGDENDVVIGTSDDGTAPGGATAKPAVLNGTSATLSWTLPTDPDLSGVSVVRMQGSTVQKTVYVPAPVTAFADSGLTLGSTYTYAITAVDRSGNTAAAASRQLTALKAAPTVADPTSTTSAKAAFPVSFAAVAPSTAKFYVDYLPVGTSTYKHWVTGAAGRVRTFGVAGTTNVATTTSVPGTNYTLRVMIKDAYGNASPWVYNPRAVVPFDQTKATLVGGTTVSSAAAYLSKYYRMATTRSYAKVTLTGNRLQIVGWKCSTCGSFDVYDGSTRVATVSSYATSTKVRTVLYTRTYTRVGTHTFTIRPRGTAGHPNVVLDGFAMRR
jgi:hypothetical protein